MADFVLEGPKWGSTGLGTAGGIVTWAIDATIPASFLTAISSAFADWAHYANIQFQEVASTVSSQIDFSLVAIDGLNNVLGQKPRLSLRVRRRPGRNGAHRKMSAYVQ